MEGLRCAVCRERFYVGESVRLIADTTVKSEKDRIAYSFDINEEGEQEICAIHPLCGTIVLHFERDGEAHSIVVISK